MPKEQPLIIYCVISVGIKCGKKLLVDWIIVTNQRSIFLGAEGFTSEEEHEMLVRIEKQLKRRFAIGTQVSQQNIIQDFIHQQYPERAIVKVIQTMIRRGQLQHRMQRKMLYRIS